MHSKDSLKDGSHGFHLPADDFHSQQARLGLQNLHAAHTECRASTQNGCACLNTRISSNTAPIAIN